MTKEELTKKVESLEKALADLKVQVGQVEQVEQVDKDEDSLQPYNWAGGPDEEIYYVNEYGVVTKESTSYDELFRFSTHEEASNFAMRLEVLSAINNLKKSLGDEHEFVKGSDNFYVGYDTEEGEWGCEHEFYFDNCMHYFESEGNVEKVVKYLNENYPKGWEY